ncbi:MAG: hypothetical protein RBR26_10155 [Methanosarcina mazei]|jgi:hypothetical protein|nr:hypothetical protein [Methanosarcina mazei]
MVPGATLQVFPVKVVICISTKDVKQKEFVYKIDEKGDATEI